MNKKTLISTLALTALLGTAVALPTTASAHEVIKEKRVTVIKKTHGDVGRGGLKYHREAPRRWEPPRYSHRYRHDDRGYGHKYGHRERRFERHDHRPVYQQRDYHRHDDGVRIRIGYDFWM